jgi:hypothetical protein
MRKIYIIMMLLGAHLSKAQVVTPKDSSTLKNDTAKEVYKPAIPVEIDTLSYAQEYKRGVWRTTWGVRGGVSQGKYKIGEAQVIRVSSSGTPLLVDGKVVRDNLVINEDFATGFTAGFFMRFVRGSFYIQPEVNYAQKAGKFDIIASNGNLFKRVDGSFSSLDVPVLLGLRFRKTRIFFGPTANFGLKLNKSMKEAIGLYSVENLDKSFFDKPKFNIQTGIGFEFGKFLIDFRYEKSLNSYTSIKLGPSNSPQTFELFPDAFHFSVGYIH